MNILILTQGEDPHVASVAKLIKEKGGNPIIFERYRRDHFICYYYSKNNISLTLKIGNETYDIQKDFQSVWWRIKPVLAGELPGGSNNENEQMCMHEWKHALHAFEFFLEKAKWINSMAATLKMSKKAVQLLLALECGLVIPQTIITNNRDEALKLFENDNKVIYKTLSSFFSENTAIYTNQVDKDIHFNDPDSLAIAPGIFQHLIEKSHELRVTIVGNKIFTAKINSQQSSETIIDWRHGNYDEMFSTGLLSEKTSKQLLHFHKKSGLIYAAYDFIVDKQGEEIFLECNPSGQWLWLEDKPGLAISEAMADELLYR